jgi:hypothetical protein
VRGIVATAGLSLAASSGCINLQSHSCSDVYYFCNQTTVTLQAANDAWMPGTYTLALELDGTPVQCTVDVTDPPPASGVAGVCGLDSPLRVRLETVNSCPPPVCDQTACRGTTCTPIPGHFQMTLVITSLPARLGVELSLGGNTVLSQTIAPKQTTTEPNGAGCGTCTNASATLSVQGK